MYVGGCYYLRWASFCIA